MNDLTGKKFGRLTAIEPTGKKASNGAIIWKCICDCGNVNFVDSGSLTKGRVQSCGCLRKPHEIEQGKRIAAETKRRAIPENKTEVVLVNIKCSHMCVCYRYREEVQNGR